MSKTYPRCLFSPEAAGKRGEGEVGGGGGYQREKEKKTTKKMHQTPRDLTARFSCLDRAAGALQSTW